MPVFRERQPWPMKWIVLTIIVGVVVYTYLTLHFRKKEPAFQPYQDIRARATTIRLLSAGYQRITLVPQRPADPATIESVATSATALGGIPSDLRTTLIDQPLLPAEITAVSAAPAVSALLPYSIQFTCNVTDNHRQLVSADLYVKAGALYIVPGFEVLHDDALLARSRESVVLLTVPGGALKPGNYEATLVGEHASKTWTVQVR